MEGCNKPLKSLYNGKLFPIMWRENWSVTAPLKLSLNLSIMESYSPLCGEKTRCNWPSSWFNYSKNAGLALDANLTLMLRRGVHRLASVLERELLRLAFELKRRAGWGCAFDKGREVRVWRPPRLTKDARSASEVGTRPPCLRGPRLRLSLLIFW